MRNKTGSISLRNRLIWNSVTALAVAAIGFTLFFYFFVFRNVQETAALKNQVLAKTYADRVSDTLNGPLSILEFVQKEYDVHKKTPHELGQQQINSTLSHIVATYEAILDIEILNPDGIVLYSGSGEDNINNIRSGEVFFREAITSNETIYWSTPFMSTGVGELTYNVIKKMPDGGYLVLYVNMRTLSELSVAFATETSVDMQIAITDNFGKYISHTNMDLVRFRLREESIDLIIDMINEDRIYELITHETGRMIVTADRIDLTDWYVITYQPERSVFALLNKLAIGAVITLGITMVLALIIAARSANAISAYIRSLLKSFTRAKMNNFKVRMDASWITELNDLGQGFNEMMAIIDNRNERLQELAFIDTLTGAGTRLSLIENLKACDIAVDVSEGALVFIDINSFKIINDVFGHEIGDRLLVYVADSLRECFDSKFHRVFRLSADEYAVLSMAPLSEKETEERLSALFETLEEGVIIDGHRIIAGLSVGYAAVPEHTDYFGHCIQMADIALLHNKKSKERITSFNIERLEDVQGRASMEVELRDALKTNRFELHFQPQIHIATGEFDGCEALVRMRDRDGELIEPNKFIPVAEETGLIVEVGDWIIHETLKTMALLSTTRAEPVTMSVNLSPVQMRAPSFKERLVNAVNASGVNRKYFVLEVTESVFIDPNDQAYVALLELLQEGFSFSLDDFGTGYSSLSYLANMPFTELKIDRAFIRDVEKQASKRNLLSSIAELGHKLGMTIVAEGVENREQLDICHQLDCDIAQGYFFAKPLRLQDLKNFMLSHDASLLRRGHKIIVRKNQLTRKGIYDAFMLNASTGIAVGDRHGNLIEYNKKLRLMYFGGEDMELEDEDIKWMLSVGDTSRRFFEMRDQITEDGVTRQMELPFRIKSGQIIWCHVTGSRFDTSGSNYRFGGIIWNFEEITKWKELQHQLELKRDEAMAANPITQLPGNSVIMFQLKRAIQENKDVAVLYGDVDCFKAYNDNYGFVRGDELIRRTAQLFKDILEGIDSEDTFVGHIGGDDFFLILPTAQVETSMDEALEGFDAMTREFYSEKDLDNGYVIQTNRKGEKEVYPLMSISIAGVNLADVRGLTHLEVIDICIEMKKVAKQTAGSTLKMNKRLYGMTERDKQLGER